MQTVVGSTLVIENHIYMENWIVTTGKFMGKGADMNVELPGYVLVI